jgi:hypothetical protein
VFAHVQGYIVRVAIRIRIVLNVYEKEDEFFFLTVSENSMSLDVMALLGRWSVEGVQKAKHLTPPHPLAIFRKINSEIEEIVKYYCRQLKLFILHIHFEYFRLIHKTVIIIIIIITTTTTTMAVA